MGISPHLSPLRWGEWGEGKISDMFCLGYWVIMAEAFVHLVRVNNTQ